MTESTHTKIEHKCVYVVWADAHAGAGHWAELETEDMGEHLVTTVGLLVTEEQGGKPVHITVAQSKSPDGFYDHVIYIPTGMVRAYYELVNPDDLQPETKPSKNVSSSPREAKKPKPAPSPSLDSKAASSIQQARRPSRNAKYDYPSSRAPLEYRVPPNA